MLPVMVLTVVIGAATAMALAATTPPPPPKDAQTLTSQCAMKYAPTTNSPTAAQNAKAAMDIHKCVARGGPELPLTTDMKAVK